MLDREKFIKQLGELIAIDNLPGDSAKNSLILKKIAEMAGEGVYKEELVNNNVKTLVLSTSSDWKEPEVGYMVHADIVAGNKEQFTMKVEGDKALGRGVSDMKFSIPVGVALLNELVEKKSKTSMSVVITTDEEIGGFDGGAYLAEVVKFRPKALIVPDGGDNFVFVEKAKGVCQFLVSAKGIPAHASRPWLGRNAIEMLIEVSNKLLSKYGENNKAENWGVSMNIGKIQGGISTNQVCPEASMDLDFRYPNGVSEDQLEKELKEIAATVGDGVSVQKTDTGLPTFTDVKLPVVVKFIASLEAEEGVKIKIAPTYGASDARHFAPYNIPVLMTKPTGEAIHSDEEWISIPATLSYYRGVRRFLGL